MGFSNFIALAIMVTAVATLNANNVTDIQTSAQAAQALRPIAGSLAETIFALGVIGTGLLSVPVLAGSPAFRRLLGEEELPGCIRPPRVRARKVLQLLVLGMRIRAKRPFRSRCYAELRATARVA
jgi:Mn2+/Fe2+ NRAMP family transporter